MLEDKICRYRLSGELAFGLYVGKLREVTDAVLSICLFGDWTVLLVPTW